jgi:hypothetical protein
MILRKKLIVIRRDLLNLDILTDDVLKKGLHKRSNSELPPS